ncbi:MAG: MFS transporter [SAR202 cluster bacterium]|nr:MFS transporter [SAR202 cluster bacterium]
MQGKWRATWAGSFFFIAGTIENGSWPILLPVIADNFDVSVATIAWTLVAFALGMAGAALTSGRISDVIGHKKIALVGVTMEAAFLALCAIAPSFWIIVVLRFFQGMSRSVALNGASGLVISAWPQAERGRILGLRNGMAAGGLLLGPVYAGAVGDVSSWRWALLGVVVLYVVHFGLVAALGRRDAARDAKASDMLRRLDWAGAVAFLVAICSFLYSAQLVRNWSSLPFAIAGFGLAAAALYAAIKFEGRSAMPVLNLGLFKSRQFSAAGAGLIGFSMTFGAVTFLFPFYMQRGIGWSLAFAGLVMTTLNFVQIWGSPLMGWLSDKLGARTIQSVGLAAMVAALLLGSRLGGAPATWHVVAVLLIVGAAMSIYTQPNNRVIFNAVPPNAMGSANAISAVGRYIGQSLGTAAAAAMLAGQTSVPQAFSSAMVVLAVVTAVVITATLLVPGRSAVAVPTPGPTAGRR